MSISLNKISSAAVHPFLPDGVPQASLSLSSPEQQKAQMKEELIDRSESPDLFDVLDPTFGQGSTGCLSQKTKNRILSVVSTAGLMGSIALRATALRTDKVGSVFSTFAIGAFFQGICENTFSEKAIQIQHTFNMDHAFKIWFTLSQIGLLFATDDAERENIPQTVFVNLLMAFFGQYTITKISKIYHTKMGDLPADYTQEKYLGHSNSIELLLEPSDRTDFLKSQLLFKGVPAAAIAISSAFSPATVPLQNAAAFFLGDVAGIASALLADKKIRHLVDTQDGQDRSKSLQRILLAMRISYIFGGNFSGAFFVFNHPAASTASGFVSGLCKPAAKRNFELYPQVDKVYRSKGQEKINKVINAAFFTSFLAWASYNMYDYSGVSERVALGTSVVVLPTAFFLKNQLNKKFKWGQNNKLVNSLQFYTEVYPLVTILPYLFIQQITKIGSTALSNKKSPEAILGAACAYISYFGSLGADMEKIKPRFNEVLDFLQGEFLFWSLGIKK